jgi:hypothetical protein
MQATKTVRFRREHVVRWSSAWEEAGGKYVADGPPAAESDRRNLPRTCAKEIPPGDCYSRQHHDSIALLRRRF